jgi:hypothetical protein
MGIPVQMRSAAGESSVSQRVPAFQHLHSMGLSDSHPDTYTGELCWQVPLAVALLVTGGKTPVQTIWRTGSDSVWRTNGYWSSAIE